MASKVATINGDDEPKPKRPAALKRQVSNAEPNFLVKVTGGWTEFRGFLGDVRGEMRKVVTPTRKEVEATTTVVIVAVFLFGLFFFVTDSVFAYGLDKLLKQLGGIQQ
ncbi:MAG: preprotein translocase subunit SecE [Terracidiphilus sp.]|jgi:preprotein translocase subunit SecE